jgi:hypothetical protein
MSKKGIETLKEALLNCGPFHPGKITQQWVKCGKKNCKCRDPINPQKHGPYYQLSYANGKKNSSIFLKESEVKDAEQWISSFNTFKAQLEELTAAYIDLAKKTRWKGSPPPPL